VLVLAAHQGAPESHSAGLSGAALP